MRIIVLLLYFTFSLLANKIDTNASKYITKQLPASTIEDINVTTENVNNIEFSDLYTNESLTEIQTAVVDINETNNTHEIIIPLVEEDINQTKKTVSLEDDMLFKSNREEGFTLAEAILYSLDKNPKIKASTQKIIQSQQKVKEELAFHLPVIDLSGNTGREARTFEEDYSSGKKTLAAQTQEYKYNKTELFLTLKENLWSGGKIQNRVNEQDKRVQAAKFDHREKIETAALDIIKSYINVVYGEIAVNISKKNMIDYQRILEIVKIKEENGASTEGDVNFILANVENAKASLVNTQAKLSDALAQYEYLMEEVDESNMPYETDINLNKTNLEESLIYMQQNNAKLLRQKSYIDATSFALKAQKSNYHPSVDFSINAESKNEFDEGLGQTNKVNALVTFNYNLYNGGKDEAAYLRILSILKEQKFTYYDQRRKLIFETKVLHRSVSSMEDSLKLTQSEVTAARNVVESYWIAFKHGTQDLQALQLAQRNLNRAELDYANYKKSLILNNFSLMKKTGELLKFLNIASDD